MAKSRQASASDAEICMKLYDLRREAEMRKARNFINFQFHPQSADDFLKLALAIGSQENAWLRMVFSYWEYVASLLLQGVVHPGLFFAWNGELVFLYAKFKPFLEEVRKKMENPEFMGGVEKAVKSSPEIQKRVAMIQKRMAKIMAARSQAAAERL
jgi:hypothetical protein